MFTFIHKISWAIATTFILLSSLYFSFKLKFIQCNFKEMIKKLFQKKTHEDSISSFQSLMMVLAGRIGVGSIAGVALSISLGGIGSIFWMWVIGFLSAVLAYVETYLAIRYKEKDQKYIYKGGPSYYIDKGLHNKKLAYVYSIFVFLANVIGFITIQANTIYKSTREMILVSPYIVAYILAFLVAMIIFGGVKRIANFLSKLVPVMTFIYIGTFFYILLIHVSEVPYLFMNIVKEAFHLKPFFSSFLPMVIIGVQRGIFSNEAGLGTGAIAASTTDSNDAKGVGMVQMLGIYITTMFICTATSFVILLSPYHSLFLKDLNGIEITQFAFKYHLGNIGIFVVYISVLLFSFSTILTSYYDGESSLKYMKKRVTSLDLLLLKIFTIFLLFVGVFLPSTQLWNYVDVMVAYLAIINIYAMVSLRIKL